MWSIDLTDVIDVIDVIDVSDVIAVSDVIDVSDVIHLVCIQYICIKSITHSFQGIFELPTGASL